jgi:hypothetical protein
MIFKEERMIVLPDLLAKLIGLLVSLINPVLTLASVELIDDYPLYTMRYYGDYDRNIALIETIDDRLTAQTLAPEVSPAPAWGCSLFVAFADPASAVYGRNFDWDYSPAVLLFTDPPDGYASVSMVDIAYLGFATPATAQNIGEMSLAERARLIYAPFLPFDGMNEHGLAIGMAAVDGTPMPYDPARETRGSLEIMREVLDHARTVDEAVTIFEQYNIDMRGGPPIHYLIADATGQSVLIEFWESQMVVQPNAQPWDMATNFIRSAATRPPENMCGRYRFISRNLSEHTGQIAPDDAMTLLTGVSQGMTQWSIVYGMGTGEIRVAMHRQYDQVHTLRLPLAE